MRQRLGALGNPAPAVLQALAAVMIVPAQKKRGAYSARTARDAVIPGSMAQADPGRTGACHGGFSAIRPGRGVMDGVGFV